MPLNLRPAPPEEELRLEEQITFKRFCEGFSGVLKLGLSRLPKVKNTLDLLTVPSDLRTLRVEHYVLLKNSEITKSGDCGKRRSARSPFL